jgi:hypothetical protein
MFRTFLPENYSFASKWTKSLIWELNLLCSRKTMLKIMRSIFFRFVLVLVLYIPQISDCTGTLRINKIDWTGDYKM